VDTAEAAGETAGVPLLIAARRSVVLQPAWVTNPLIAKIRRPKGYPDGAKCGMLRCVRHLAV
jgi:outer membrane biosynthesis protein TonB